jgi:hypothetical protein
MAGVCKFCGSPTTDRDFFVVAGCRVWAHPGCILKDGERVVEGGDLDDRVIAIDWPDRPAEIMTGKRLREKK